MQCEVLFVCFSKYVFTLAWPCSERCPAGVFALMMLTGQVLIKAWCVCMCLFCPGLLPEAHLKPQSGIMETGRFLTGRQAKKNKKRMAMFVGEFVFVLALL